MDNYALWVAEGFGACLVVYFAGLAVQAVQKSFKMVAMAPK